MARQIVAPVLEASSELADSWGASTVPTARADEKSFWAKLAATLAEAKKAFGSDFDRLRAEAAEIQTKLDAGRRADCWRSLPLGRQCDFRSPCGPVFAFGRNRADLLP